jgi:hypothetical protein
MSTNGTGCLQSPHHRGKSLKHETRLGPAEHEPHPSVPSPSGRSLNRVALERKSPLYYLQSSHHCRRDPSDGSRESVFASAVATRPSARSHSSAVSSPCSTAKSPFLPRPPPATEGPLRSPPIASGSARRRGAPPDRPTAPNQRPHTNRKESPCSSATPPTSPPPAACGWYTREAPQRPSATSELTTPSVPSSSGRSLNVRENRLWGQFVLQSPRHRGASLSVEMRERTTERSVNVG